MFCPEPAHHPQQQQPQQVGANRLPGPVLHNPYLSDREKKAFYLAEEEVSLDGTLALTDSIEVQFMVKFVDNFLVFCIGRAPIFFLLFDLTLDMK